MRAGKPIDLYPHEWALAAWRALPSDGAPEGVAARESLGLGTAELVAQTGASKLVEWILGPPPAASSEAWEIARAAARQIDVAFGVRAYVLPALASEERDALRERVLTRLRGARWPEHDPRDYDQAHPDVAFFLAAQLGLHDELRALVAGWPDGAYAMRGDDEWLTHRQRPHAIVFGLASADELRAEFTRLGLRFTAAWHVAGWLAHTELTALDAVADAIGRTSDRSSAEAMLQVLACVHDDAAGPAMLELMRSSRAPALARTWLAEHPLAARLAAAGALARSGGAREDALAFLHARRRAGDDLAADLPLLDAASAERLRTLVLDVQEQPKVARADLPEELRAALDGAPAKRKLPALLEVTTLPPLTLADGSGALAPAEVEDVLRIASLAKPDAAPPALATIAAALDPDARDTFGWTLTQTWLTAGAPTNARWMLLALGAFGGDASATRLAPLIRVWPGESQHARAVLGLGVLGAIGTDTALMLLSGIAQKVKFKGLQQRARQAMDAIAAAKGMTKAQLEDRIVPDCELDEHGSRTFDYGPRSFTLVLGPAMKPLLRDGAGKLRSAPPKPGARDDAELSARAVEQWRLTRKQVADVAKVQATRLEQAMVTQRRWSVADFERFLVRHPLQRHLTRLLVWGQWRERELVRTFRVTDELDYADAADEACTLDAADEVGIVHPLQLDAAARAAWGELLSDYEVVPPFAQLGRPAFTLPDADREQTVLTHWAGRKVGASTLVRLLENVGWERGEPQDAGIVLLHAKPFPALGVTAVVEYDGVPSTAIVDWEDQSIDRCYVVDRAVGSARELDSGLHWHPERLLGALVPWGAVDPIAVSEVLADLAAIMDKQR